MSGDEYHSGRSVQPGEKLEAATTGHLDIEKKELRLQLGNPIPCLLFAPGLPHDNDSGFLFEQPPELGTEERLIIDQKAGERVHQGFL
jgi:hypothetical protein